MSIWTYTSFVPLWAGYCDDPVMTVEFPCQVQALPPSSKPGSTTTCLGSHGADGEGEGEEEGVVSVFTTSVLVGALTLTLISEALLDGWSVLVMLAEGILEALPVFCVPVVNAVKSEPLRGAVGDMVNIDEIEVSVLVGIPERDVPPRRGEQCLFASTLDETSANKTVAFDAETFMVSESCLVSYNGSCVVWGSRLGGTHTILDGNRMMQYDCKSGKRMCISKKKSPNCIFALLNSRITLSFSISPKHTSRLCAYKSTLRETHRPLLPAATIGIYGCVVADSGAGGIRRRCEQALPIFEGYFLYFRPEVVVVVVTR